MTPAGEASLCAKSGDLFVGGLLAVAALAVAAEEDQDRGPTPETVQAVRNLAAEDLRTNVVMLGECPEGLSTRSVLGPRQAAQEPVVAKSAAQTMAKAERAR